VSPEPSDDALARDVREGLTADAKRLPPKWLYDARGSKLFERITQLDDYYLTGAERELFREHAGDIVDACPAGLVGLAELGAGSAEKTRILLEALVRDQGATTYWPMDISEKALEMARDRFQDVGAVTVRPVQGEYVEALAEVPRGEGARLVAFIGSSVGNLPRREQVELLEGIRGQLGPDDRFLLGTDLAKDPQVLLPAYDDAEGVTAEFTLNLLRRINRELGGSFDLDRFRHRAVFDEDASAVRIYAESLEDQTVRVEDLDLEVDLAAGERIHVEDSFKYTEAMLAELFEAAGLRREATFTDPRGWFAEHVLAPSQRG
jgi:dimethylhistidine N-methyltransferase